jgi:hypothetical protein
MFHPRNFSVRLTRWLSALALCASLSAMSPAQVTAAKGGYLLRAKYVKGETFRYKTSTSMVGVGGNAKPMKMDAPIVMHVEDVTDGAANIKFSMGPFTVGGSAIQPARTGTMKLDARNGSTDAGPMGSGMGAQLPQTPVKVGQTWTTTAPVPDTLGQAKQLKAIYKFQGVKTVGGQKVAVITYSLTGGAKGSGTVLILASDGTLYSNSVKLGFSSGVTQGVTVSMEMRRA